jgi:hypothetical protein
VKICFSSRFPRQGGCKRRSMGSINKISLQQNHPRQWHNECVHWEAGALAVCWLLVPSRSYCVKLVCPTTTPSISRLKIQESPRAFLTFSSVNFNSYSPEFSFFFGLVNFQPLEKLFHLKSWDGKNPYCLNVLPEKNATFHIYLCECQRSDGRVTNAVDMQIGANTRNAWPERLLFKHPFLFCMHPHIHSLSSRRGH